MIKNLIKTSLLISIFALYLSLPSFAMDEYELDVGKSSLKELRKIPADKFKKFHIKLNNITSDKKFFDDNANFTQSISYKLLGAIYDMIFTKYKNTPFVINKIEYTYSEGEKKKNWQYHVDTFMAKIADGIEVIKQKDSKGEWVFEFNDLRPMYRNSRFYNTVVVRNNEIVETSDEILARSLQNIKISPTILGGLRPTIQYQATGQTLQVPFYPPNIPQQPITTRQSHQILPSGEGVYEQTIDPDTGEVGWVNQQEEEEEDRRDDIRERGFDPDEDY